MFMWETACISVKSYNTVHLATAVSVNGWRADYGEGGWCDFSLQFNTEKEKQDLGSLFLQFPLMIQFLRTQGRSALDLNVILEPEVWPYGQAHS